MSDVKDTNDGRVETKTNWTYAGVWTFKDGDQARWIDESGKDQWFGLTPKNKSEYKSKIIGGVYEVTSYRNQDGSEGMYIAGSKAPKYRTRSSDPAKIAEWQANALTRNTAKEHAKLASKAKDDVLEDAINVLRKARRNLPFNQRTAFDVLMLQRVSGNS